MENLEQFILAAKRNSYVGDKGHTLSSRIGSHDLRFEAGDFVYVDSYFGGTDFCGQEVVWHQERPMWAMGYFGSVLRADLIDTERAGRVIRDALTDMYDRKLRFLGGTRYEHLCGTYQDTNTGDFRYFSGLETIHVEDVLAYQLHYHGGLVLD